MVCYVKAFFSFEKKKNNKQPKKNKNPQNFVSSPDLAVREHNMKNRHKNINAI